LNIADVALSVLWWELMGSECLEYQGAPGDSGYCHMHSLKEERHLVLG